jgi:erythromycin esterase-like protein
VAQYVQTCQGSPRTALRGLAGVWRSLETEALVTWMCEWNQAHPDDPVHFYGFDVQVQSLQNGRAILAFLERLGIGAGDPRVEGIRVCDGVVDNWYLFGLPYPAELYERCQAALADVAVYLDANEKEVEGQTSREDLAWARIHLVGLQAWQGAAFYFEPDPIRSAEFRDRGMAYVAQAIRDLRFPHARTALWAHNTHIAKNGVAYIGAAQMGAFLTAELGHQFRSIGLVARETYIDWIYIDRCGLSFIPVGPGSVEHFFSGLGPGAGVLADLTAHPPFLTPGAAYRVGGAPMVPAEQFDALIHLDVSPMMTPTSWVPCQ